MSRGHEHAVVVGASIAGLLAARVVSSSFERVTIIERDSVAHNGGERKGVPQGRHAHALQPRGALIFEELFPGVLDELVADGVPVVGDLSEVRFSAGGHVFCQAPCPVREPLYQPSRPHLENHLRRRVRAIPNVQILDQHEMVGLVTDGTSLGVTGARIVPAASSDASIIDSDLVVDATGRGGRMIAWLEDLGVTPPAQERLVVDVKYASRHLHLPAGAMSREKVVLVGAIPDRPTGLALFPQEGDRYLLTIGGYRGHHPPTREPEFLAFARTLLPDHVYAAVRQAEPLDDIVTNRFLASTRRRYERLRAFPEGLIVFGDAICSLNPLYGQGMTVAALQAMALRRALASGHDQLAHRFFRAAAKPVSLAWQLSASNDLGLPQVEGKPPLAARVAGVLADRLLAGAEKDPVITEQFLRVAGFLDPPSTLASPRILRRLLTSAATPSRR